MPSCATTTPCSPRTAPPPSPSASTTAPSTTCAPTSVEWPTARRSGDCGPRRHDVLDTPGPERALVRHAALPPRRRPVADLRPHAHSQPRPRVVLHPGRVRRALRAPRHRQLRARHRGRGRPGGRARRGDGALRAAPASPARRAAPGAHDLRDSLDRRRRVAVDLGRHAHPASQARGPVVVVIIGGLGSLKGALFGGLLVGLLDTFGKVLFPGLAMFTIFAPMAIILALRPTGLFGAR